jgi:hypothetical protein
MFISLTQQRYLDTGSTDDGDGADGIFASCMHPDDPASGPAFANVWVRLGIAIGGLMLSVWQSQRGALLKVLAVDPATGNFTGAFISVRRAPVRAFPTIWRAVRGSRVVFQTSRNWTSD